VCLGPVAAWTAGPFDRLYLAVATSVSSTLIVVKLLSDKFELATFGGRVTLGILVFQDLFAIAFLALQPNLERLQPTVLLRALAVGAGLLAAAVAVARYVLPAFFRAIAKSSELMLVSTMAWCFLVAGAAGWLGLSREMGALVAGVVIAAFPYGPEVASRISGVRDFFITLFFVALGLKIPYPSLTLVLLALLVAAFVIGSRRRRRRRHLPPRRVAGGPRLRPVHRARRARDEAAPARHRLQPRDPRAPGDAGGRAPLRGHLQPRDAPARRDRARGDRRVRHLRLVPQGDEQPPDPAGGEGSRAGDPRGGDGGQPRRGRRALRGRRGLRPRAVRARRRAPLSRPRRSLPTRAGPRAAHPGLGALPAMSPLAEAARMRDRYAIAGVGETEYSRASGRSTRALAVEAVRKAILDAGLPMDEVDGMLSYHGNDSTPSLAVAADLGLRLNTYADVIGGGSSTEGLVAYAMGLIEVGLCRAVAIFRAMNGYSEVRIGGTGARAATPVRGLELADRPYGMLSAGQRFAPAFTRHMYEYGTTSAQVAGVKVAHSRHAALNPKALLKTPVTVADVLASRWVVKPLHLLDCCLETDNATALVVTSAARARDLRARPVYVMAAAGRVSKARPDFLYQGRFTTVAGAHARDLVFGAAGIGPEAGDVTGADDARTFTARPQLAEYGV